MSNRETRERVYEFVAGADHAVDIHEVAEAVRRSTGRANQHLLRLVREGRLERENRPLGFAQTRYCYRAARGAAGRPEPTPAGELPRVLLDGWWGPVREAIVRNRAHWRRGELFR